MVGVGRQSLNIGSEGRSNPCCTIGLFSGEIASSMTRSFFLLCGGVLYIGVYVRGLLSGNRFDEAMQSFTFAKKITRLNLDESGLFTRTTARQFITLGLYLISQWGGGRMCIPGSDLWI